MSSVDLLNVLLQPDPVEEFEPRARLAPAPGADGDRAAARRRRIATRRCRSSSAGMRKRRCAKRTIPAPICARGCAPSATRSAAACEARRRRRSTSRSARTVASTGWRWISRRSRRVKNRARRHAERRRARHRRRRRASLPRAPAANPGRRPRLPRDGAGERAQRRRARQRSAIACRRGWCRCRSASATRADGSRRSARRRRALKESKQALGAEVLARGRRVDAVDLAVARRAARRRARLPFNLVVTNVPGPQVPLYLLGARMLDNYGLVPLTDNLCLGVVLFSYAGKLCWGFTAEWDLHAGPSRFRARRRGVVSRARGARACRHAEGALQRQASSPLAVARRGTAAGVATPAD